MLIPEPPPATGHAIADGLNMLAYVIAGHGTARATDEQLHRADHAYPIAMAAADLTDQTRERFTAARHEVLAALRRRTADRPPIAPEPTHAPIVSRESPHGRVPQPTRPPVLPPAGDAVTIDF